MYSYTDRWWSTPGEAAVAGVLMLAGAALEWGVGDQVGELLIGNGSEPCPCINRPLKSAGGQSASANNR